MRQIRLNFDLTKIVLLDYNGMFILSQLVDIDFHDLLMRANSFSMVIFCLGRTRSLSLSLTPSL